MKTVLVYKQNLPGRSLFPVNSVLLYDSVLNRHSFFRQWKKNFAYQVPLKAGENLKTLDSLNLILKKLMAIKIPQTHDLTFIAVGGGSVGDFAGFLASTFLRGRNFVQIPSTWLAAVDSAHGGKNGLNFQGVKNQIGTVTLANRVFLVHQLLQSQPPVRVDDSLGEVLKIGIINCPVIFEKLEQKNKAINVYQMLPQLIESKLKIVKKDPLEKNGQRRLLNLGHTLGHVLESHFLLSHGQAVKLGVLFAAKWSFHLGYLQQKDFIKIFNVIHKLGPTDLPEKLKKISVARAKKLLSKDKKLLSSTKVDFIFIQKIGKVFKQKVTLQSIVREMQRQKLEL